MHTSVSSKLLRSLPSNELCFLVLFLPTRLASAALRYYGRSDSSPHWTSSVRMAASFRASTLRPDARARPRFSALVSGAPPPACSGHSLERGLLGSPPRFFRTAQSGTTWGRPRRYGSLSPSRLGASTWWAAWPRFPLGLIHRFNLSAYSSVLCLLAHRTFPRGNALPVGYLARRASTRIGLQPIRSGDYPATPTPPLQGGEYARLNSFTASMAAPTETALVSIFLRPGAIAPNESQMQNSPQRNPASAET